MPNLADLSTATKLLLGAGVLMFIDLIFDWQRVCVSAPGFPEQCAGRSGWAGWGMLVGLLLIALIAWELLQLFGVLRNVTLPVAATLISAALAAAILLFTIIKFLVDGEARSWPAWVGLLLAIAIAVGGWLKWKETPESERAVRGRSGAPGDTATTPSSGPAATTPGSTTAPGGTTTGPGGTTTGPGGTTTGPGGTTTGPGGTTTGPGGTTTTPGGSSTTEPGGPTPPPAPPA